MRVAYETYGHPHRDPSGAITNAVLVLHALTGDAHVVGERRARSADPWLVGCADRARSGARHHHVARGLGERPRRVPGHDRPVLRRAGRPSLGIAVPAHHDPRPGRRRGGPRGRAGHRAVRGRGRRVDGRHARAGVGGVAARTASRAALVLAVGAAATGDQIATQSTQLLAIRSDPRWRGGDYHSAPPGEGPHDGLGLARRIAHLTYRGEYELDVRFGRDPQAGEDPLAAERHGRFAVQSYLDHHADKLAHRFDAGSYVVLTDAMNTHDVGRGRGGLATALGAVTVPMVVGGIDTDRLYPLRLQQEIADLVPTCAGLRTVRSDHGHDGFLIESGAVGELVRETLALAGRDLHALTGS